MMFRVRDLVRPTVKRITPYSPGKSSAEVFAELGISDVIKLASNEHPLGPSPLAIKAMQDAAAETAVYPDPLCVKLTQALADHLQVLADNIIVGRGSDEVIHMLGLAFLNPGEEIVFSQYPFAMYPITAYLSDCVAVQVPAKGFDHDLDAMAAAVTDKTKLIFIGNPCNPTGTIVTARQVEEFMNRMPDHVVVIFDEAYFEYVDDPAFPDTLTYVREGRKVAVLRTFSKVYALAGLRIGYGACSKSVADALKLVREPFNVSSMAQVAALASLKDREHVRRSVQMVAEGKAYLYEQLDLMGLEYVPTQGNFVLVNTGRDSRAIFDALMRRGITVRTGDIFGLHTWIRVTIGTLEHKQSFIKALIEALNEVAE